MENEVKKRIAKTETEIKLLKFHKLTLEAMLRKKEEKIYSNITDAHGEKTVSPASLVDEENLKNRYDYIKYGLELLDITDQIESLEMLVNNDKAHIDKTLKEETQSISDPEILDAIYKMKELPLKGKKKEVAINLANDFLTGNVVGLTNRYEYYMAVKNMIAQNKEEGGKSEKTESKLKAPSLIKF